MLEDQAVLTRRPLDGLTQGLRRHRPEQEQAVLDEHGQARVGRHVAGVIGPQGEHDASPPGVADEGVEESLALPLVLAQGERLLGLVDEQDGVEAHRAVVRASTGWRPGVSTARVCALASEGSGQPGAQQGRLPAAGGADHGQEGHRRQPLETDPRLLLAPEERLRVLLAVRREAGVRRDSVAARRGRLHRELRVLPEDGLLQGDQVGTGIQPEVPGEDDPDAAKGAQRLHLPPREVLRLGQQGPPSLPERSGLDHDRRLSQDLRVVAGRQRGLDLELLQLEAHLLEAVHLGDSRLPRLQLAERTAAPEVQRLGGDVPRTFGLVEGQQLAGTTSGPRELVGVHGVGLDPEAVAVPRGLDQVRAEQLAEPADASLEVLRPGRRWRVTPHGVGELLQGEHVSRMHGQR